MAQSLIDVIASAISNGDITAIMLASDLISKVRVVDLTDDQALALAVIIHKERERNEEH